MIRELREVVRYREMLFNTVRRELRARYKGSVLGFLWTFLNPLLTLLVYTLVFSAVLRVSVPQYSFGLYLFTGLLPWLFLSGSVQLSTSLIHNNANLIKKIHFPRLVLPLAMVATNLVNLLLSSLILVAALLIERVTFSWFLLYVPLLLVVLVAFVLGLSLLLSSLTVYFRDLEHIAGIVTMAWFYLTPIVYTTAMLPPQLYAWLRFNPMTPLFEAIHDCVLYARAPEPLGLVYAAAVSAVLLAAGFLVFGRLQRRFAEEL